MMLDLFPGTVVITECIILNGERYILLPVLPYCHTFEVNKRSQRNLFIDPLDGKIYLDHFIRIDRSVVLNAYREIQ